LLLLWSTCKNWKSGARFHVALDNQCDKSHGRHFGGKIVLTPKETMKIRSAAVVVGLAICFALPTFAQIKNTPDPQLRQKLVDVIAKHADAINKNDAAAAAACFTQDAVYVTERGPVNEREAIEKWYADLFKKVKFTYYVITIDQDSPHVISTADNEIWAAGGWSSTIKGENFGPRQIKGYWSVIRVGDDWRIRMLLNPRIGN
jgi:uncharacterized protein (TIGR02246 family)